MKIFCLKNCINLIRGRGRGFNRNPRDLRFSLNRGSFRGFRGYQRGRGSFGGQWQGNR